MSYTPSTLDVAYNAALTDVPTKSARAWLAARIASATKRILRFIWSFSRAKSAFFVESSYITYAEWAPLNAAPAKIAAAFTLGELAHPSRAPASKDDFKPNVAFSRSAPPSCAAQ